MAFDEKRYNWLMSQFEWHKSRDGKWHRSQAKFYIRCANRMPGLFSYVMQKAIRANASAIAASISSNNALLSRLSASNG